MLELYRNIKSRRLDLGLTQEELAYKVGYKDRTSIAKIESGKVDLSQSKIKLFADALNTTPGWLMGWTNFDIDTKIIDDFKNRFDSLSKEKNLSSDFLKDELKIDSIDFIDSETIKLIKIADYFDISIDYLLGRTDIRKHTEHDIKLLAAHKTGGYDDQMTDEEIDMANAFIDTYRKTKKK